MTEVVLVTGAAGFIGSHLSARLLEAGCRVVGIDNFCDFYDPAIKRRRAAELAQRGDCRIVEADIRDADAVEQAFAEYRPSVVVHLAAMAGVRPSIANPAYYTQVNLDGTVNLLDTAVAYDVQRFVFASSSSVYGNNDKVPFAEDDPVNEPISPYAATKRSGELICHSYWHIHQLPIFCLRFFTVFGPGQRPDLAISKFLRLLRDGQSIPMFGDGQTSRDYTYIDDIVDGVMAAIDRCDRYRIYNLGGNHPVTLSHLIETIGKVVGREPKIERLPMQSGDVERTYADLTRSAAELGYGPQVTLEQGIRRQWQAMSEGKLFSCQTGEAAASDA
jgi:UDP-glucuronate 4-epimerase